MFHLTSYFLILFLFHNCYSWLIFSVIISLFNCVDKEELASSASSGGTTRTSTIHRRRRADAPQLLPCSGQERVEFCCSKRFKSFLGRHTSSIKSTCHKCDIGPYHLFNHQYSPDQKCDILPNQQSDQRSCTDHFHRTLTNPESKAPTRANTHSSPLYKPPFSPLFNH